MSIHTLLSFIGETWECFSKARAAGRGAAISFYSVTAILPVLVIVIAIASIFIGRDAASIALFAEFDNLLGNRGADLFRKSVAAMADEAVISIATLISTLTLIFTASGVFLELEEALNAIWGAKPRENLVTMARARAISLGLVVALGFVLVISLVIDALITSVSASITARLPFGKMALLGLSELVTVTLMTIIFAGVMRYLPRCRVAWRDTLWGSAFAATMFVGGKVLIGLYLGSNSTVTALGEAGGLLALLFWVYFTAQIFLFGAAVSSVIANRRAGKARARRIAVARAPSQITET